MNFARDIAREEFDNFVRNHPTKSHFLQSWAWGEFQEQRGRKVYHVGMRAEDGSLCAAALLIRFRRRGFKPYLYCPRGPVLDYSDFNLLSEFTTELREFAKSVSAMCVTIDPDIERWSIDEHGTPCGTVDNNNLIAYLEYLGYKHFGFNKNFESKQPRYTFKIDLARDKKSIEKSFTGSVMKNVKKSHNYASEVIIGNGDDVKTFHEMISLVEERDHFVDFPLDYYQDLYDVLAANGLATLYLGKTHPIETVRMLEESLDELLTQREKIKKPGPLKENMERESKIRKEIELFKKYAEKYPEGKVLCAHLVVQYGEKAWAVHAGSTLEMSETFLNNRVYHDKIMDCKAKGALIFDQFGTVGDWETSNLRSLHEFKKQFGGRYVEFIGEFNLVTDRFAFFIFNLAKRIIRGGKDY